MGIKCFMIRPTGKQRTYLRQYASAENGKCGEYSFHNAKFYIGDTERVTDKDGYHHETPAEQYKDNPNWPTHCESCGYEFLPTDERQIFAREIYQDEQGNEYDLDNAPPGAMWNAWWLANRGHWRGPDGQCLIVVLPNGRHWTIDGRASNCTRPDDNEHKCWVRHGEPPNITVDKNGDTCSAGAGSIMAGDYHGFLRNGEFT